MVAVDQVDFEVAAGEILGVIGPNGAGKTTCFEMVAGFTAPDTGTVVFDGIDVTRATPEQRARQGLVRSFQDAALFPTLTVRETLMVAQERVAPTRLWESALGVPTGGAGQGRRPPTRCSSGCGSRRYADARGRRAVDRHPARRRAGLPARRSSRGCCCSTSRRAGIAQSESEALGDLLLAIRRELGTTMVVIEHDLPLLSRLSDRMLAMNLGRVIATGTPDEVRNDPAVVALLPRRRPGRHPTLAPPVTVPADRPNG